MLRVNDSELALGTVRIDILPGVCRYRSAPGYVWFEVRGLQGQVLVCLFAWINAIAVRAETYLILLSRCISGQEPNKPRL